MRPSLFAAHSQDSERRGLHGSGFRTLADAVSMTVSGGIPTIPARRMGRQASFRA